MSMGKKAQKNRGFITIELLIAVGIVALSMSAILLVSFGGQTAGLDVGLTRYGFHSTVSNIEEDIASALTGWTSFADASEDDGFYAYQRTVTPYSPCTTLLNGSMDWSSEKERAQNIGVETLIANPEIAQALGGDCDPFPPGEGWESPDSYDIDDPIFSGSQGTDIDAIERPDAPYAIVTTEKQPGKATLWMIDVTDLDLDPLPTYTYTTAADLFAIDATDDYAFVAGASTTGQFQFQVVDIADPAEVGLLLAAQRPLPEADTGVGRSIAYRSGRVYLGTQYLPCPACPSTQNNEFHIFDVTTPASPTWLGSYDVNRNVNAIATDGTYAYLAVGASSGGPEVRVYDVSDPANVTPIGSFNASGDESGTALFLAGSRLYLGRENTPSGRSDFYVIDISNPALPVELGSVRLNISNPNDSKVVGIVVKGNLAYISTTDTTPANGGGPFLIYDVSDPLNMFSTISCPLNYSEKAAGLDVLGDYAYIANESNDAFRVIYPTPACTP